WAASALGILGNNSEMVVNKLLAQIQKEDYSVGKWIAIALNKLGNCSEVLFRNLVAGLDNEDYLVRNNAAKALGKLGKKSNNILPTIIQWIQQHQDSEYLGSGINALWYLVVGEES
ncbi:MAG: HEAT repeat domain-containing protein, partial [Okeania sp. SIO3B3]|nr:HEAT repeat domain-containing protein [Okeania sp. SIO3B3]